MNNGYVDFEINIIEKKDLTYVIQTKDNLSGSRGGVFEICAKKVGNDFKNYDFLSRSPDFKKNKFLIKKYSVKSSAIDEISDAIFESGNYKYFYDLKGEAVKNNKILRVKINLHSAGRLLNLPWEYLSVKQPDGRDYLCLLKGVTVVRGKLSYDASYIAKKNIGKPKIFLYVSGFDDGGKFKSEIDFLLKCSQISIVNKRRYMDLDYSEIVDLFEKKYFDVFHYIGHAGICNENNSPFLYIKKENKNKCYLEDFCQLFKDKKIWLIYLNACKTSSLPVNDFYSGLSQRVSGKYCSVVIGNQYDIANDVAIQCSQVFYENVRNKTVDEALDLAREKVRSKGGALAEQFGYQTIYYSSTESYHFVKKTVAFTVFSIIYLLVMSPVFLMLGIIFHG